VARKWEFNFEAGGEKKLVGNRTASKMLEILGDRWREMSADRQALLVDDILRFESEEELAAHLQRAWGFTSTDAAALSEVEFEPGHHSLSRRAIRKLLPRMEQGEPFATARKAVYGERLLPAQELDELPALDKAIP